MCEMAASQLAGNHCWLITQVDSRKWPLKWHCVYVQYVGIHLADMQLVLHRSVLPNSVIYVTIQQLVPDVSSAQIPR